LKITLTQPELEHAIGCYLRANAAVKVGEITFSAKKTGVETIVETTVLEVGNTSPEVEPIAFDEQESEEPEVFTEQEPVVEHVPEPEELVSELPEQIDIEEAIANVEAAEKEVENPAFDFPTGLTFDSPVEPETVEEMPVQNTLSIADILGSPS
tara:strand:- start:426 stop:887 length:462 start_codon:yes stop_codon:yes gene_type:complete